MLPLMCLCLQAQLHASVSVAAFCPVGSVYIMPCCLVSLDDLLLMLAILQCSSFPYKLSLNVHACMHCTCVCVCVHLGQCVHVPCTACIWKSEDNLWELVLSCVNYKDCSQLLILIASALNTEPSHRRPLEKF